MRAAAKKGSRPLAEHAVDVAIFTVKEHELHVLVTVRQDPPAKGALSLPGGFVCFGLAAGCGTGEDLEEAALRILHDKTGLDVKVGHLEQLRTYGRPNRDTRGRVISTAYVALVPSLPAALADGALLCPVQQLPEGLLAFDHGEMLRDATARVRGKIEYTGRLAASFLAEPFTIPELRRVYEAVWGRTIRSSDFRRKVLSSKGFLIPTGERRTDTGGPPAPLYTLGAETELYPPILQRSVPRERSELDGC